MEISPIMLSARIFFSHGTKMINTLNETSLHKTLKSMYAEKTDGKTEVAIPPYIADVVSADGEIIEIQTASPGKLLKKIEFFLSQGKKIRVVYPLAVKKIIETQNPETGEISGRKSPSSKTLISVFREITQLTEILTARNFSLEIVEAEITEKRILTGEAVQSKNRRRRFRKNWIKTGKSLNSAGKIFVLHGKSSYKKLLPENLPQFFTSAEFFDGMKAKFPRAKRDECSVMLWVLAKIGVVEQAGKKGRSKIYVVR